MRTCGKLTKLTDQRHLKELMGSVVKNLSFPFGVRNTYQKKKHAISFIPLNKLQLISAMPKKQQPLVQYNFKIAKYKDKWDHNRFHCEFTDKETRQTVVVLDFDGIKSDHAQNDVRCCMWDNFKIKPILEETTNGFHAILPFNVIIKTDDQFHQLVHGLARILPEYLQKCLDPYSYHRGHHWYHVRFYNKWIKNDWINITAQQQKNGVFFNEEVSLTAKPVFRILASFMHELHEQSDVMLNYSHMFAEHFIQGGKKNVTEFTEIATEFLYRILVEGDRRRGSDSLLSEIRSRTEEIQRQAEGNLFTCEFDDAIRAIKRVFGVDGELADRVERSGSTGSASADSGSTEKVTVLCNASDTQEGNGDCLGSSSGDEKYTERGLPSHSRVERVLAFVSEFQSLLRREQLIINSMGHFVSEDRVRSDEHRGDEPKEQDYALFNGVCRQILERYCGQLGITTPSYVSLYEWFRYTRRHLGDIQHDGRSLSKTADEILRGMRLSDTRLGTGRLQEIMVKDANWLKFKFNDQEEIDSLIESFFDHNWRMRVGSEKYADRVWSFWKNHPERFRAGLENMFGWFARMRNKMQDRTVDIGKNMFVYWFGSTELATYLRKLILEKLADTNHTYSPFQRTKRWFFSSSFMDAWGKRFANLISSLSNINPEKLAEKMGNGQTFTTISKTVVSLMVRWSGNARRIKSVLLEALALSSANEQRQRQRDIEKYVEKVERLYNHNQLQISHGGVI